MAKTKENDWGVFLTELGYDANNPGEKAVIDALLGKRTKPGKLASLWTQDVLPDKCEEWSSSHSSVNLVRWLPEQKIIDPSPWNAYIHRENSTKHPIPACSSCPWVIV